MKNGMRPVHPGEILREDYLTSLGMSARALAQALRVPPPRVNESSASGAGSPRTRRCAWRDTSGETHGRGSIYRRPTICVSPKLVTPAESNEKSRRRRREGDANSDPVPFVARYSELATGSSVQCRSRYRSSRIVHHRLFHYRRSRCLCLRGFDARTDRRRLSHRLSNHFPARQ
jgi:hypothetical protein